jgi:hypothetical protein
MKKTLFICLVFVLFMPISAQIFSRGTNMMSLGYGFPNLQKSVLMLLENQQNFRATGTGPVHFRYESGLSNTWSLGASINVSLYGAEWLDSGFKARLNVTTYSVLFRINNYFLNEENVQVYGGLGAGYRARSAIYNNSKPGAIKSEDVNTLMSKVTLPIGFEATIGLRGRFASGFGGYIELGLAKSIIQSGLYFSF